VRLNAKHFVVAIIFMFAQICASATIYDHLGDPLHSGDDCTICTTVNADTDDTPPLPTPRISHPLILEQFAAPLPERALARRHLCSDRARAPPTFV